MRDSAGPRRPEEENLSRLRDGLEAERESFGTRLGDKPDG
jgi:hypothetical protein